MASQNFGQEQLVLLDTMLDSARPPQERAEAGRKLAECGDPRPGVGVSADGVPDIAWVDLPGGSFPMGGDDEGWNCLPAQPVTLESFSIARYLVTNSQWDAFLRSPDGYQNSRWWDGLAGGQQQTSDPAWTYANHPREHVNWYEAMAFCRWMTHSLDMQGTGSVVRLPTDEEWERAARGQEGRLFPWGQTYISGYANVDETNQLGDGEAVGPFCIDQTTAVGIYPQGATPEGIHDLSGNVGEWTMTDWQSGTVDEGLSSPRVVRGGSWFGPLVNARAASRFRYAPPGRISRLGFRVVRASPLA